MSRCTIGRAPAKWTPRWIWRSELRTIRAAHARIGSSARGKQHRAGEPFAALEPIRYGGGANGPGVMSLIGPLRTHCERTMNDSLLSSDLLSPNLLRQIRDGNAILFLGAGASHGTTHRTNGHIPGTADLREALSDRFLGGSLKDRSLADVAEYAKNESSLDEVQRLVYDLFEPLMPASFHHLIPSFRWHAIVTT